MSKEHRDARVVGPDPKDTTSFTKDTKLLSPKQGDGEVSFYFRIGNLTDGTCVLCTVVDALALEAKSHLESIVGEGAKELTVPVPFLPPPAPASIVDAPGPAPEDRPKAPGSEEEVKQMAKEDKKRKETRRRAAGSHATGEFAAEGEARHGDGKPDDGSTVRRRARPRNRTDQDRLHAQGETPALLFFAKRISKTNAD